MGWNHRKRRTRPSAKGNKGCLPQQWPGSRLKRNVSTMPGETAWKSFREENVKGLPLHNGLKRAHPAGRSPEAQMDTEHRTWWSPVHAGSSSNTKTSTAEKGELPSLDFLFLVKFEVLLCRIIGGKKSKAQLSNDRAPAALDKIKHQYKNPPYKLVNEISNLGLRHTKLFPNFLLKEIFSSSGMSKWSYLPPSQTNLSQHFQPCLAQRLDRPGNFLQQVPSWSGPIAPGEIYGKPFLIGITDWHWLVLLQRQVLFTPHGHRISITVREWVGLHILLLISRWRSEAIIHQQHPEKLKGTFCGTSLLPPNSCISLFSFVSLAHLARHVKLLELNAPGCNFHPDYNYYCNCYNSGRLHICQTGNWTSWGRKQSWL